MTQEISMTAPAGLAGWWPGVSRREAGHPSLTGHSKPADVAMAALSKVPEVTLGFWVIKILATTLGETGGDMLSMSMNLGYALSTVILFVPFLVLVVLQVRAKRFHAFLYWGVIVGTTLAGTTMADFADRSLGIGYPGGASILFALVMLSLLVWKLSVGTVSVDTIVTPKAEIFYWVTILFSNTLGTALGDWTSEGTGFAGGVGLFFALLAVIALLYYFTKISRTLLFWTAFILTRPLGASMGDLLTKPRVDGGLNLSRFLASGLIAVLMILCIVIFPQKAGEHPGSTDRL
jgi:uncharacterized membrane-anchored protein